MNRKTKTIYCVHRRGAALLVVLLIVMMATVLSLGFLSRSDTELACGQNMILHTQMDYLAESGLEHAKGLILSPQDVSTDFWAGNQNLQLAAGSDNYYDVAVVQLDTCNYQITSEGYRLKGVEKVGRSSLVAELRLDPCIALWTGAGTVIPADAVVNGDVYCGGSLKNSGMIAGDVFAAGLSGGGSKTGQLKAPEDLSLSWPRVTVGDFTSNYSVQTIVSGVLANTTFSSGSDEVYYHNGDLELAGSVLVEGMLIVAGNLTVSGNGNTITAEKNLPALLVTGDMIIENAGQLQITGLAVVDKSVKLSAGAAGLSITGGLFVGNDITETTADSSGNGNIGILYNGPICQPAGGHEGGAFAFDGIDDKIEESAADSYLNGLSAVTLSLWVKSNATDQDHGIFFVQEPTANDENLGLRYDSHGAFGGGSSIIKASIRTTAGYTQIESTSNVQTTAWQHLALVWQSGLGLKLYINGNLNELTYDRGALSGSVSAVQKFMLGRGTKGNYWDGMLDDVRIYDRVLDVNDIYPPQEGLAGLLMHWKLDEQVGGEINVTAAPLNSAIFVWSDTGVREKWGQAAGAFFRSVERN